VTILDTGSGRLTHWHGPGPGSIAWLAGTAIGLLAWQDGDAARAAWLGALALAMAVVGFAVRRAGPPAGVARPQAAAASEGPTCSGLLPLCLPAMSIVLAITLAAAAATQLRIAHRVAQQLDPALEGRDIRVTGTVASLPARMAGGQRFVLAVSSASWHDGPLAVGTDVPPQVSLAWFTGWDDAAATRSAPVREIRAGERLTLVVRLRRPHGARNPHGFDLERHLFAQGVRATGTVRQALPVASDDRAAAHPVQRARQAVRDALVQHAGDGRSAGVLAALAIGDTSGIDRDDWTLFRDTGVAHLMAISGLHVTMFAWVAGLATAALWRRSGRGTLALPAPTAARLAGLAAATAYAVFAGWGVPAQRTVGLLAVVTLLAMVGRRWPWPAALSVAGAAVSVGDPWALLDVGFWLSFVAVALLLAAGPALERPSIAAAAGGAQPAPTRGIRARAQAALPGVVRDGLRTQFVCSVGLAPLTLILFQQVSVVGWLANLVAVPWVTLIVTPLALAGLLWPAAWSLGVLAVDALAMALQAFAAVPGATWTAAAVSWPVQLAALLGGVLAVAPLPWRWRLAAVPLVLPLLWPVVPRPPEGRFDLVVPDVGQGTAVLVRTRHHLLVYDAGPAIGRDGDAGERMLLPLLRSRGERRIDRLVLSHRDLDHVGGAASLIDAWPVTALWSSLEPGHPLLARAQQRGVHVQTCAAGQAWTWDGVRFELLHPAAAASAASSVPDFGGLRAPWGDRRSNDRSCVLRVTAAPSREAVRPTARSDGGAAAVLLTGDIEAAAEAALLARVPDALAAPVVLVPHHGSRTSSTPAFVAATGARWAVVQAGHRSRFGHPAADVVARWRDAGATVIATPQCGAWSWPAREVTPVCERERVRRHWHHPGAPTPRAPPAPHRPGAPRTLKARAAGCRCTMMARVLLNQKRAGGSRMTPPFDEMHAAAQAVRPHYQGYAAWLAQQPPDSMRARRDEAEMIFRRVGITFAVYGAKDEDGSGTERLIPFDLIPRIIPAHEWQRMQQGLRQRVTALNRFVHDVYHGQEILKAGVVPREQVVSNAQFRPEMMGVDVAGGVYSHIAGIDIVRAADPDGTGRYYVLEDNLRVPSGVSYMLENRKMMMRLFPELFAAHRVEPVAHYPDLLLETLRAVAPSGVSDPTVVVLTPGMYNSAYFEHAFLAQQMGVELVEGQDLVVRDGFVYMRTTQGPRRVDVIYRRVDDDFLDPSVFRRDSSLGCAGLLDAYRRGNVTLANAIGTGVADDKSIYPYVPKMIEFYLGEKPILDNVPTWQCREPEDLAYVLAHLPELVVKEVHGAGGYGMLVGPAATRAEIEDFRKVLQARPDGYIAQPTLALSTCPTYVESGIAPRHIDLRPFVLSGKTVQMVPGGLTRVALKEGSLVVNSSQGGGTKDTWVLEA
jgi:DNA internalization-related competence protein ComEC/Rec2